MRQFWLNLPVKDIKRAKDFYSKVGFTFNTQYSDPNSACIFLGDAKVPLMLFQEDQFMGFTGHNIVDTIQATEVLLSIDAQTKEEVDEMVERVIAAGGTSPHVAGPMTGWMYGCIFVDPDGHRWNILHMDPSKMK